MASGSGASATVGADDLLRLLQRSAHASVAGRSYARASVRARLAGSEVMTCVLRGMAQVTTAGGAKKDSAAMVGPAEPSTWWYTFDRAIPWLDARQQNQPPFHPAWATIPESVR